MYIFALNYVLQYSLFAEHSWVIYWAHKTYQRLLENLKINKNIQEKTSESVETFTFEKTSEKEHKQSPNYFYPLVRSNKSFFKGRGDGSVQCLSISAPATTMVVE